MKSTSDTIIQPEQAKYLDTLLPPLDELMTEIVDFSHEHNIPSSDREVALFLAITARAVNAHRALEIGTAIGYGAITLARAMPEGSLVTTIDPSEQRVLVAREFIRRARVEQKIEIIQAKALTALPQLKGPFDLAYLDAVKEEYPQYLELIVPRMRIGGVILVDNVLWKGQVATGRLLAPDQAESTSALITFNRRFTAHPQLQSVILPFGDGLGYGVRIA